MKPTDDQILRTLEELAKPDCEIVKDNQIENKYNGYCGAFGGVVVRMGLLQAVMLYHNDDNRKKINDIIFKVYKNFNEVDNKIESLFYYLKGEDRKFEDSRIRIEIVQIATALKMAIRTYKLKTND